MIRGRALALPLALAAALSPDSARALEGGAWELVHSQDGIEVHRRTVVGSRILEFRGRGVIEAPVPRLLAVLLDVERRTEWTERCAEAGLIEKLTERTQISYNRTNAPWPVADRDVVLYGETLVDAGSSLVRVEFHSIVDARVPPRKGVVRMPSLRGHWHFTPIKGRAATYAEYQVHADPGGALPVWVANLAAKQIPWKTLASMRRQSQRRTYPVLEAWIRRQPEFQRLSTQRTL